MAFLDLKGSAFITYTAAIACLIFVFLHHFKMFKGMGIEAHILEQKIEEVTVLKSQMLGFLKPMAELHFSMVARHSRYGAHLPREKSHRLINEIEAVLKTTGMTPEEITIIKKDVHHVWTAPRVRRFFRSMQPGQVLSCVRPLCAAPMTAGLDEIRQDWVPLITSAQSCA